MGGISDATRVKVRAAWPALIAAVEGEGTINDACAAAGLTRHDVRHYRLQDPEAEREWQIAREQSADHFAEKVVEIANNPNADASRARVQLDAYRWLAAKRNPKVYSDKSQVDVNVRTVDLTRIIGDANARLTAARNPELAARAGAAVDAEIVRLALPNAIKDLL